MDITRWIAKNARLVVKGRSTARNHNRIMDLSEHIPSVKALIVDWSLFLVQRGNKNKVRHAQI